MEFEIKENEYRTTKMDVLRQFHISRKIAPVIPTLIPIFGQLAADAKANAEKAKAEGRTPDASDMLSLSMDKMSLVLGPFADALASMKEEDVDYIMDVCLATVSRKVTVGNSANWARIGSAKALAFDDIDLSVVFPIVTKVIWENLGPFINGFLSNAPAAPANP